MNNSKRNINSKASLVADHASDNKRINWNRFLSFLVYAFSVYTSFAQNITGKVVDENNEPMEFVNVVLLTCTDSVFIAGTVTQKDGSFLFEELNAKNGVVKLTSIGYATQAKLVPPTGNFGTITMSPENIMLGEVIVKSHRPITAIKGNTLVTNVENSVLAHAGTANDVLTQVPMVLGREGNFEVFGKGTPFIYINGRKVQDLAELSQINSSDIKNVEVITNPGAKYDASVKSVIRIRTKRPQGDGWSGTLRAQNGFQHYFGTREQANLKYRTGGLELFGNFGYLNGKFQSRGTNDMLTRGSSLMDQLIESNGNMRNNEFFGKLGFSYLFNENHSIGTYYSNGFSRQTDRGGYNSRILIDDVLTDEIVSSGSNKYRNYPKHSANLYYNGMIGKLGIDLNLDYMWKKNRVNMLNDETGSFSGNTVVNSFSNNHNRLFAQKLVLSYPLWKGEIEFGEEYTSSRLKNLYKTDAMQVNDAFSQVDEKNTSGFFQIMQRIGKFELSAGVRYEHVDFSYLENGQMKTDQSKTYDNLFPTLSVSTMLKDLQMSLSYTNKTMRPNYEDLDGTVDYINRFTLEGGNPFLKPEKIHSIEFMGAWHQFFTQVSYSYKRNPFLNTTVPYDESGEIKLLTMENFSHIKRLEAFIGSQFGFGIWLPKFNIGIVKQWFTVDYGNERKKLNNPIAMVQWQNAIHLPGDIWLNIDMQWMSKGNEGNSLLESSSYLNAKLYKAFCKNRFSVTLEANDIFNKSARDFTFYNKDVTLYQKNLSNNRSFQLTLQYNFNTTRDRYRGRGAGQSEKDRF